MISTVAALITPGRTIQFGKIRGKVDKMAHAFGPKGSLGFVVLTLMNGRKLIIAGQQSIKVK